MIKRFQFNISGRVQGVGFRPVVFRYSVAHGLSGFVKNTPSGVVIEVEGEETSIFDFISCLKHKPPEQSRIEAITFQDIPLEKTGKQLKKD